MRGPAAREEFAAGVGLVLTALCWGTMTPLTAVLLERLPPFVIAAGRYTLGLAVLAPIIGLREGLPILPPGLPWGRILLLGGAGIGGFATCYTFGIAYSGPIAAAAILATQPVVAALMSWSAGGHPIDRRTAIAVLITVAGGMLVAFGHPSEPLSTVRGGEILLFLGLFCWTWYSMKAQTWLAPLGIGQLRLTLVTTGAAGLCLWAVYCLGAAFGLQPLPAPPGIGHVAILLWLAIGPTAIAILAWNRGTARLGITTASLFLNLSPVFATLLGIALGAEASLAEVAGGALALAGVIFMQLGSLRRSGEGKT